VHFTPEYTEATDGHRAVRISYPEQLNADDLPSDVKTGPVADIKPFLIPAKSAKDITFNKAGRKNPLPFMTQSFVDVDATNANGDASFYSTNLESKSNPVIRKVDAQYPNVDKVWPTELGIVLQIAVDPNYLAELAEIAATLTKDARDPCMLLTFYSPNSPIRLQARNFEDPNQRMDAVLMPMRFEPETFGYPEKVEENNNEKGGNDNV
jgi:hypothetical protein